MLRASVFTLALAGLSAAARAQEAPGRIPDVVFVGTPAELVSGMLALAGVGDTDVVYDLGSGDGRIVIAAAREYGARGVGIELDPALVRESRGSADSAGVANLVEFHQGDLFEADLRPATVVTLYLGRTLNERLRPVLLRDLEPGSRVVSQAFDMGDWTPDSVIRVKGRNVSETPIHLWIVPARVGGRWRMSLADGDPLQGAPLELSQRYQRIAGRASGRPLAGAVLRGDRIRFRLGARQFTGRVAGRRIEGTVSASGGTTSGWRAIRTEGP
jgi:hypothetical protein